MATRATPPCVTACAQFNLGRYADAVRGDWRYRKDSFRTDRSKTPRGLEAFDCIAAPCLDECPVDQQVPRYMAAVRSGEFAEAVRITRLAIVLLPAVLGRVCDHLCENTCIRTHLDQPLAIRQIKRFIMEQEREASPRTAPSASAARVAIVGAGPAGLAAAEWLAYAGVPRHDLRGASICRRHGRRGDPRSTACHRRRSTRISAFSSAWASRSDTASVPASTSRLMSCSQPGSRPSSWPWAPNWRSGSACRARISCGAIDGVTFLRSVREGRPVAIGARVGVVGAGDTAMDCVRAARRVGASSVSLIYRRTIDQMPADPEEIHAIRDEGIRIVELARPVGLRIEDGALAGVACTRTEYRGTRDAAGRKVPHDVPGSEFEIGVDTLILAISQHPVLDFFGGRPPDLTPGGFIAVDPETFETSLPGVYAGGDVAGGGPSSIVKAAADGKRVAAAILASVGAPGSAVGAVSGSERQRPGRCRRRIPPRPVRRTCRRWWSGERVASTGCRSGSAASIAVMASRRPCWGTRPRRRCMRRVAASTATRSAACASASAPTWR